MIFGWIATVFSTMQGNELFIFRKSKSTIWESLNDLGEAKTQ